MSAARVAMALALAATAAEAWSFITANQPGQGPHGVAQSMPIWSTHDMHMMEIPLYQRKGIYVDVGKVAPAGSEVTVTAGLQPLLMHVYVFTCYPCPATHAGFLEVLMRQEGFVASRYGPEGFQNGAYPGQGPMYNFQTLIKRIPPMTTYTLPVPEGAQYVSFLAAEHPDFVDCPAFGDRAACEAPEPPLGCKWSDAEGCLFDYGFPVNVGPGQGQGCPVPESCAPSPLS